MSFDQVATALAESVAKLTSDPAKAVEVLGAIQNAAVAERVEKARTMGEILLDSKTLQHPEFPNARVRTPMLLKFNSVDESKIMQEVFGPVSFVIATNDTAQSLAIAEKAAREHGAMTLSVYSSNEDVTTRAIEVAEDAGVALSINLTGGVFVNQSAAFSDFHGTGANPAANAALTDSAFVASRFRVVQHRFHV
jgi:phenylacetic acid degradation protein paaN